MAGSDSSPGGDPYLRAAKAAVGFAASMAASEVWWMCNDRATVDPSGPEAARLQHVIEEVTRRAMDKYEKALGEGD